MFVVRMRVVLVQFDSQKSKFWRLWVLSTAISAKSRINGGRFPPDIF